jgi:hypothetical protein
VKVQAGAFSRHHMTLESKSTNQRVRSSSANDAIIATLVPRCAIIESRKANLNKTKSEEDKS